MAVVLAAAGVFSAPDLPSIYVIFRMRANANLVYAHLVSGRAEIPGGGQEMPPLRWVCDIKV